MCQVKSCWNYSGEKSGLCKYHLLNFGIKQIIQEEKQKNQNIAVPVHDRRTVKLIYEMYA